MEIEKLRSEKEKKLYPIVMAVAILVWGLLVIGTLGIGLLYIGFGALFYLMVHALFLAGVKGNGVRIDREQLPELQERIVNASRRLGLGAPPEAYLLNHRGLFNAFATRFLGRDFIVLYAELLEACDDQEGSIDFIIGHEIAHHAFGHLKKNALLLPARVVPLLGPAYSRACEYSCDQAGMDVAGALDPAVRGLAVLAAGGKYAKRLNVDAYLRQRLDTGGFWLAVLELGMSHPYLPKRVGALLARQRPDAVPEVPRHPLAYVFAPFFGFASAGAGGGLGAMMIVVAIIGMMAAIAIPNLVRYQERARAAQTQLHQRELERARALDQLRNDAPDTTLRHP
jgi:Zn-dependent protease with chaperone function